MRGRLLVLLLLVAGCAQVETVARTIGLAPRVVVDWIVSPTGNDAGVGGCSESQPCSPRYAMSVANPGDFITMLPGTYQGPNYMLVNVGGRSGSAGNPITIRARPPEGQVLIDGGHVRDPVVFYNVHHWSLIGVNARYGAPNGHAVIYIYTSDSITLQRVVAWDAYAAAAAESQFNNQVILIWHGSNVLLEDVAAFGTGKQMILDFEDDGPVTYRRVFARNEGGGQMDSSSAVQVNYHSNSKNPTPPLIENSIFTIYGPRGTIASFDCGGHPCGFNYLTETERDDSASPYTRQLGGINYLRSIVSGAIAGAGYDRLVDDGRPSCNGWIIRDGIYHTNGQLSRAFFVLSSDVGGCSPPGNQAVGYPRELTRVLAVSPVASSVATATTTNFVNATSLAGTGFDYTGTSSTPRLCYRYQDGVYTSTPLWPWPMDERIKAAIGLNTVANGALMGAGSPALAGSGNPTAGYTAGTVTSEIVSIFGTIPQACLTGAPPPVFVPNFPVVTDFPSVACCLDDFNRANGAVGTNWTTVAGAGFNVASNVAVPNGSSVRALWNASLFAGAHEVYATVPTQVADGTPTVLLIFGATTLTDTGWQLLLTRTVGANDTLTLVRISGGYTEILGPIDLGSDVVDGNSFGVRVSPAQNISVYWNYSGTWYRIGTVIDTNIPTTNVRIGMGATTGETRENFGGGTCCGATNNPNPATIGRFGRLFPTQ